MLVTNIDVFQERKNIFNSLDLSSNVDAFSSWFFLIPSFSTKRTLWLSNVLVTSYYDWIQNKQHSANKYPLFERIVVLATSTANDVSAPAVCEPTDEMKQNVSPYSICNQGLCFPLYIVYNNSPEDPYLTPLSGIGFSRILATQPLAPSKL